jgi:hypothetical protein
LSEETCTSLIVNFTLPIIGNPTINEISDRDDTGEALQADNMPSPQSSERWKQLDAALQMF